MRHLVVVMCDGVINRRCYAAGTALQQNPQFLPGALDGLRLLAREGFHVVAISNATPSPANRQESTCRKRLRQQWLLDIALCGGRIERFYRCPQLANESEENRLRVKSDLLSRILAASRTPPEDVYMVSDTAEDLAIAARLGCDGFLLRREAFLCDQVPPAAAPEIACNLRDAAERMVTRRCNPFLRALQSLAPSVARGR